VQLPLAHFAGTLAPHVTLHCAVATPAQLTWHDPLHTTVHVPAFVQLMLPPLPDVTLHVLLSEQS